jgi:hypothetical protein
LHTQIATVQAVSGFCPQAAAEYHDDDDESPALRTLTTLRSLVQTTFSALVSASAARGGGGSFPRLFTRLVSTMASITASAGSETRYTEFRAILAVTGIMKAYRAEGDMLVITKRMLDRDVFETCRVDDLFS